MQKISKFICNHKVLIIVIALLLIIPAVIGIKSTKVNYDILAYLPSDLETVKGQEVLTEEFNMGSFAIVLMDSDVPNKNVIEIENQIRNMPNVGYVLGPVDVMGTTIPNEMIPQSAKEKIEKNGYVPILVTFTTSISDEETLKAIEDMRNIVGENSKVGGMSATQDDTKIASDSEMALYVVIAVIFCLIVLEVALDSYIVPLILLGGIGISIIYNMGTNVFLGEISFITKAIATVLQLGVTMDFSIFLCHSYQRNKNQNPNNTEAMVEAIKKTFISIIGSSTTTIAGFLALCTMDLALGTDIGIVMAKGVLIGVICVVTILPAMLLVFDKMISKTKHKEILPKFTSIKKIVVKHKTAIIVIFLVLLVPAIYGNSHVNVYYNIANALSDDLPGVTANKELAEDYNMVSTQIALVDKDLDSTKMNELLDKIDNLDGVEWTLSINDFIGSTVPEEMIPDDIKGAMESENYKMVIINSTYETATEESNNLVNEINGLLKSYDENSILAGEAPLMKDLVEIADHDFQSVNIMSVAVILIIMIFVLKSISLPIILVAVIEFAIFLNMSISCYTGETMPFIASIVIGTIQLGATVDYAILITTKYIQYRKQGKNKNEAVGLALDESVSSIIVSAMCFFAATCGVSLISKLEMIGSICTLISRGAIISMIVVIFILPAFLIALDKLICKTTRGMKELK